MMPRNRMAPALPLTSIGKAERPWRFSGEEWTRLAGIYGFIAFLHVLGWGIFLHYSLQFVSLAGLGFAAYMLGLRHAFDADHDAAVDDTVRYLLQKGETPLGIGFFFSLGHSTIVLGLSVALIFSAAAVKAHIPDLTLMGGLIGAGVAGAFLWSVGLLNLLVLLDLLRVWRFGKTAKHDHAQLDVLLSKRGGLMNRLFGGRLQKIIRKSWQMYPLGMLFGLGFDTASEVGLLAMTAAASATDLPVAAALSLPILFAAGMSAMDTTDGVLMVKAYRWALVNPLRRIFYNITTTSLSIAVALVIGTLQIAQVVVALLDWKGPFVDFLGGLEFSIMGYVIVGLFLVSWAVSALVWKFGPIERC